MKRLISLLALIILFAFALPQTSFAGDDEEGVSSLEKGDPIRHLMLLRSGRFEIAPTVQTGVNETFQMTLGFGAQLSYYFTNYLGLGASFYYNPLHFDKDEVDRVAKSDYSEDVRSTLALAQPTMNFDVGLTYAPIMGKFNLFNWILNYDVHLFGGFGAIIMDTVCASGDSACEDAKNNSLEGAKFAGVVGIGARVFFNNFVAMNLDVKNYLTSYSEYSRTPTDDNAHFKDFVTASIGVSFFFPMTVYMSR